MKKFIIIMIFAIVSLGYCNYQYPSRENDAKYNELRDSYMEWSILIGSILIYVIYRFIDEPKDDNDRNKDK